MKYFILILLLCLSTGAHALDDIKITQQEFDENYVIPYVRDFVTVPEGGISWDIFAETKEIPYNEKDKDGFDNIGTRPQFPASLQKLDGQTVILQGYMFPLQESDGQTEFLFGPFPLSCPYHYHAGPRLTVEAHAKTPVKFTYDAVTLTGTLVLVPRDDDTNVFYRLKDARIHTK